MSARKLAGEWSIRLEPFIIQEQRNGLVYEKDMEQDRVVIVQGKTVRHIGWYPRKIGVVLPLSGMIHPDDIAEIQKLVQIQLCIDEKDWKPPAEIIDPGRNAAEQEADSQPDEDEEEDEDE